MVAYSFNAQFVAPILSGRKAQTIRAPRADGRHAAEGDALQLYTGMRTRQCRLILKTRCTGTEDILLRWRPVIEVEVGGVRLAIRDYDAFAQADGFVDFSAMEDFWATQHPGREIFNGILISWAPPSGVVEMGTDLNREVA